MTRSFNLSRFGLSVLMTLATVTGARAAAADGALFSGGELVDTGRQTRVPCVARETGPRPAVMLGAPMTELLCTGASLADAQIFAAEKEMERDWSTHVNTNYQCGPATPQQLFLTIPLKEGDPSRPVTVQHCQSHDRDRKVVVLQVAAKERHYYAVGLEMAQSAMVQTMATLLGWRDREPLPPGTPLPDVPDGSDLVGTDPQAAYFAASRAAETYMALEDYAKAERALDKAIQAWNLASGGGSEARSGKIPVTLKLMRALAISNQGKDRARDAEQQFEEVDRLLQVIKPLASHQLYRVMHLTNNNKLKEAEELLKPILAHYRDMLKRGGDPRRLSPELEQGRLYGSRDNLTMQLDVPPSLMERTSLEVLDNYKAALYVLAEIRMRQGDGRGAIKALRDGLRVIRNDLPSANAAYVQRTWGEAIEGPDHDGDLSAAIDKLEIASDTLQTIDQRGRPAAITWLRLAAMQYRKEDIAVGIQAFEAAGNNLRASGQFVKAEDLEPHLAVLYEKSQQADRDTAAKLRLQMVDALQLLRGPRVQGAMIDNALLSGSATLQQAMKKRDDLKSAIEARQNDIDSLLRGDVTGARAAERLRTLRHQNAEDTKTLAAAEGDVALQQAMHERNRLQSAIGERQREINRLLQGRLTEEVEERLQTLRKQNGQDEMALTTAEDRIGVAAPAYRLLARRPADIREMQQKLAEGEAVVTFLMGAKRTFGFLIDKDRISVWQSDLLRARGEELVRRIHDSAAQPDAPVGADRALALAPFDADAAYALFQGLFLNDGTLTYPGPDGKARPYTDLIVVSSGALASIPFSLLVTAPPENDQKSWNDVEPGQIPWLLHKLPIRYLPSLQALFYLRREREHVAYEREYLGFGDPLKPRAAQIGSIREECMPGLKSVVEADEISAQEELTNVRAGFGAKADIVLAENFTAAAIEAAPLANYRFLHFASHAVPANTVACFAEPGIQVTPAAPVHSIDQMFLSATAVSRLRISAELVILSACSTAAGASAYDEPLSGLVNGFLVAGAGGVMTTFWDATDAPARHTTLDLFEMLRRNKGISTPAALRHVQRAMLARGANPAWHRNWGHPNSWALFGLIGDGRKSPH